jgi:hypothetical protein
MDFHRAGAEVYDEAGFAARGGCGLRAGVAQTFDEMGA